MTLVIPSIDLSNGVCAHSIVGEDNTEEMYHGFANDPIRLCQLMRRENSKCLHINDLDSFQGMSNLINANAVLYMIDAVDIPLQYYSDFATINECKLYLDSGIYRIVIGELALGDPEGVRQLIKTYSASRVIFSLSAENRYIYFHNSRNHLKDTDFINQIRNLGGNRVIYSDRNPIQENFAERLSFLAKLSMETGIKITVNEEIDNADDLIEMNKYNQYGIDSVILGSALFHNNFPCQTIWRKAEAEVEPGLFCQA